MATKHIHIHFSDNSFTEIPFSVKVVDTDVEASAREAAATLGHFGGMARASKLAPGRRKQIAIKAAKARWRKHKSESGRSIESSNK
jgi:hypothetical protein